MIVSAATYVHVKFSYKWPHLIITAYSGDTCSEDTNGCAEIECFSGVECFDIPAPGVGAMCGPCETGFTGDGVKCAGISSDVYIIIVIHILSRK